ncbi:AlwI family type II restriction endonuclease [Helicobacter trogontum]|uniref:AlwI family type II restriction endonuclease n=1 Tax=Helicobacter trogontum TaxID=50960 RepID=A0A4U8S228_9HELI|nr:AlwI family type II restriction endonuclease [Helicobacter trogontum]TLD79760.1 AlwI family type II restriction endonuclease [Helicobacter trogontum]
MEVKYSYFGNTSNRVKNLLYNFETQLILFDELFKNASKNDIWSNDSELQIRYLELLEQHNLLKSKNKITHLGTKDARVKSAPLENYGLIKRKEKLITKQGYELLSLIENQSYKKINDFLQIDLISLFFFKSSFLFQKDNVKDLFSKYIKVFRYFEGSLTKDIFYLLPLIDNCENTESFCKSVRNGNIINEILNNNQNFKNDLKSFLKDLQKDSLDTKYFTTAKGDKSAKDIIEALKVFLDFRQSNNKAILNGFLKSKDTKYKRFKELYLGYICYKTKIDDKIEQLSHFCEGDILSFGKRFFRFIATSKIQSNLDDYLDLNKRHLKLTGIFDFSKDCVSVSIIFKIILKHSKSEVILSTIAQNAISKDMLSNYFNDSEMKSLLEEFDIKNPKDLSNYKANLDNQKLDVLLKEKFSKDKICEILSLFNDRNNDEKIFNLVTTEVTIPTIFEYIIAIAWCYIDNFNKNRILEAGLSLDSEMLPKSHAIGGNADFVYRYNNHYLIIEVTLTEKTNQRRAEMESVSRHLGNLLLSLETKTQDQSYGIFVAPYLDKNVLNDFRSRLTCYYENDTSFICGMKILPLSVDDLKTILKTNYTYNELLKHFYELLNSKNTWGSKWYSNEIAPFIKGLINA